MLRRVDARRPPTPPVPEVGPFRPSFWRSPLRGPWLAAILSSALAPLLLVCTVTGLLSHAAYNPDLGSNALFSPQPDFYFFHWPTSPAWLYVATQGLHVITGFAAIPLLLAKLWTVIPKLFERPTVRSLAHGLERLSLLLLVGSSLFVLATGVLNVQLDYVFGFNFVIGHYYGAMVFVAALTFHIVVKVGVLRQAFRERGVTAPLREDLAHTEPEPELEGRHTSAPVAASRPTMTRRLLLGTVGAGSLGLTAMAVGQVVGGPLRPLALLTPRGQGIGPGPNQFPINKTFQSVGIPRKAVGSDWRLTLMVDGKPRARFDRAQLMRMPQVSADLPIACVEGWSTTQRWTGVPVSELARLARVDADEVEVRSLQPSGVFRRTTLARNQLDDPHSLLALKVNGADLSLDHGFPARLIVPAQPGVHCTKWVAVLDFTDSQASASPPHPSAERA